MSPTYNFDCVIRNIFKIKPVWLRTESNAYFLETARAAKRDLVRLALLSFKIPF